MANTLPKLIAAFLNGQAYPKTVLNTATDGRQLTVYGNAIAEHREDGLYATLAGWPTQLTLDRLSLLPGVAATTVSCNIHLNGKLWDGEWVRIEDKEGNVLDFNESPEAAQLYLGHTRRTKREQMSHEARKGGNV